MYVHTYSEYLGTHGELGMQLATLTYAYIFSDALKYDLPITPKKIKTWR